MRHLPVIIKKLDYVGFSMQWTIQLYPGTPWHPMTMEPPTSCSALFSHEVPTQGCLRDFLWSAGQRPQHLRDEWTWSTWWLRNERMHESAPKDIASYYILLHIIFNLFYMNLNPTAMLIIIESVGKKRLCQPTALCWSLLSPQNRCSGISKHCGGVQFQAARALLQLDFSGREPWKWHSNPPIEK